MLGEKEKQVVSARANDANKLIDWLIFLIRPWDMTEWSSLTNIFTSGSY